METDEKIKFLKQNYSNTIFSAFEETFPFSADKPISLLHYTSINNVENIISSKQIWMTESRFCNDRSELEEAKELFVHKVRNFMGTAPKNWKPVLKRVADRVDKTISDVFLFCLSEPTEMAVPADNLIQWRAYASDGNGVAIAFEPDCLINSLNASNSIYGSAPLLGKVVYNKKIKIEAIEHILNEAIGKTPPPSSDQECNAVAQLLLYNFRSLIPFFKNEHFESENEWRIILPRSQALDESMRDATHTRDSDRGSIVFIKAHLNTCIYKDNLAGITKDNYPLPILKLTLAPAQSRDTAAHYLRHILERAGFTEAFEMITESEIPYRG